MRKTNNSLVVKKRYNITDGASQTKHSAGTLIAALQSLTINLNLKRKRRKSKLPLCEPRGSM